mmetsp:Transcript_133596/g.243587  ORF Transcript_133596/g.243587 Transcript_133596/m.243587 type:complete len:298 (+) Transcript_133596:66-959(+)
MSTCDSRAMRIIPILLLCVTYAERQTSMKHEPTSALAQILLSSNPTAGYQAGNLITSRAIRQNVGPTTGLLTQAEISMQAIAEAPAEESEISKVPGGEFIDADEMLAQSTFKIKPDALIKRAKEVLLAGVGVDDESVLAEDFEFCAPVVGPLKKEEYLNALRNFDLLTAFPDMNSRFYNLHVDPFEHNRVWWFTRTLATHTGPLLGKPPTNKALELPPQANSFTFNEEGKVTQVTVGYVLDRRVGNTGGLGGAFAFFYGTGNPLPIPECQPYKKSFRFRALGWMAKLGRMLPKGKNK